MRVVTISLIGLLAAACRPQPSEPAPLPPPPALPPLELRPVLPEWQQGAELAASVVRPDEQRMVQLRDLIETAWIPGYADARTRSMAERSLADEDGIAWALEAGLEHDEPAVRAGCARKLAELGHQASIPKLLRQLRDLQYELDVAVRCALIESLARMGQLGTVIELAERMRDPATAQVAGLAAVEVIRPRVEDLGDAPSYTGLITEVERLDAHWRQFGVDTPFEYESGAPTPNILLQGRLQGMLVTLAGFNLRSVDDTRFVFSKLGVRGSVYLEEGLHAENDYVRSHTIEIVTKRGRRGQALSDHLLPLLGSAKDGPAAAVALGEVRVAEAYPHLIARLRADSIEMRAAAAYALGPLGDVRAVPELQRLLDDEQEVVDVKVNAAFALAMLDPGRRYLQGLLERDAYHRPTLREMIDRVDAERR